MSKSRLSYIRYLTPAAFTPAKEVKQDITRSPYAEDVKLISTYPKKDSKAFDTEKKPFEDQFNQLLDAFSAWGTENKCDTEAVKAGIAKMKSRFFDPSFSGMQSPLYFETIKQNLEKILIALQDIQVLLDKRKKVYVSLCPNLANCGPSLYTYTDQAQLELFPNESLEGWLIGLRTSIIDRYADGYTAKNRIMDTNSIHVNHAFTFYAADQKHKWSSTYSAKQIKDPFTTSFPTKNIGHDQKQIWVNMKIEDLADFHSYFENEYNPTAIRSCIEFNVHLMLSRLFARYNFDEKKWNDTIQNDSTPDRIGKDYGALTDNYGQFIKKLRSVFEESGLTFSEEKFFEYGVDDEGETDYSKFRLRDRDTLIRSNVDTLCNRVLATAPELYFDPVEKRYCDLVPAHWLNDEIEPTTTVFDFSVWDITPNEPFRDVLFPLLNILPKKYIGSLLEEISPGKILEMTKNGEQYAKALSIIVDTEKQAVITKKISTIVSLRDKEEKEEKDEKGAHKLFKHRANKMLHSLLLHVIHGEQKEAKAIIEKNPQLLLDVGQVTDYSGRRIQGTALQMALGAEDVEMCQMIITYLDDRYPAEKVRQYQKQFPPDEKEEKDPPEMKALNAIAQVILQAQEGEITADSNLNLHINNPQIEAALAQFREAFNPKGVITQGKHFNAAVLLAALELNVKLYKTFGDKWDSPENMLFWCQVVGYIQRFSPACYAQAWCQGLCNIIENKKKLERSLYFRLDPDVPFFPLDSDPKSRLGFGYAPGARGMLCRAVAFAWPGQLFETYVKQKQQELQNLCNPEVLVQIREVLAM